MHRSISGGKATTVNLGLMFQKACKNTGRKCYGAALIPLLIVLWWNITDIWVQLVRHAHLLNDLIMLYCSSLWSGNYLVRSGVCIPSRHRPLNIKCTVIYPTIGTLYLTHPFRRLIKLLANLLQLFPFYLHSGTQSDSPPSMHSSAFWKSSFCNSFSFLNWIFSCTSIIIIIIIIIA